MLKTRTATFIRHYVEMVAVMFAGMIVLGLPGEAALRALGSGTSELTNDAPAVVFLGMAATMTIPMVAWMRFRGHRWQPTLGTLALLGSGILEGAGPLMIVLHAVMLPAMLVAMLLRFDEYAGHHHGSAREVVAA